MKITLRAIDVSRGERAVLIEMAYAVDDAAPIYSWGRDRLADVLGKEQGSTAAKSAVDRALASLRARGLITLVAKPHRGRRAEYALSVLDPNGHRSERCAFDDGESGGDHSRSTNAHRSERGALSRVTHADDANAHRFEQGMDIGFERMDIGLSDVPPSATPPISPTGKRIASAARRPSDRQMVFVSDISRLLDIVAAPESSADADEFIRENWPEIERRAHNGEPFDCSIADLSPATRRYAREHGLLLSESEANSA